MNTRNALIAAVMVAASVAAPAHAQDEMVRAHEAMSVPGDRIRPLGCRYERRLKEVLIDRKVPRPERDRLPLLCVGDRVVWVPGITVDDDYRLSTESRPWVARIEPC